MTEPNQISLDAMLATAARAIPTPDPDSFANAVVGRLRSQLSDEARLRPAPRRRRWRPILTVPATLVALCAVVATLVPAVRSTLTDLLGGGGAPAPRVALPVAAPTIPRPVPTTPLTSGSPATTLAPDPIVALHLGTATTLRQAALVVGFLMRLPTIGGYQKPDAVFVGTPPATGTASMVYLPMAGRPAVPQGGVSALLSEFRGRLEPVSIERLAGNGVDVQAVMVGGARGYWLTGASRQFPYVKPDGTVGTQTIRLATNTLLWSFGSITYLFESARSRDAAIAIAVSMR